VTREGLRNAVAAQDIDAMVGMLHRVPVTAGDAYFIPGRFPHAIGSGVFLLEVQEPTDWVVQPERFVGHTELSDSDMWGPLEPEIGLDCFDYDGAGEVDDVLDRVRLRGETLLETPGGTVERLVGPDVTDCFRVDRLTVEGEMDYAPDAPYHTAIVTDGAGQILTDAGAMPVKRGDTLFLPNAVRSVRYEAGAERLQLFVITRG
jgi:mannose-6-phosphate isomerase